MKGLLTSSSITQLDRFVASWFHENVPHFWVRVLWVLSHAGCASWIAIVLAAAVVYLAWKRNWRALTAVVLTVPGGLLLNLLIKYLVHRQRPLFSPRFHGWDAYSFPSGHTIGATLLYGLTIAFVFTLVQRWHVRLMSALAAGFMILLVGFSRIVLGAHYLSDVVGAMAIGTAWLCICFMIVQALPRRRVVEISE